MIITVRSKDKKPTKVEFLEIGQDLLTSINDWVKSQKNAINDAILQKWLQLASDAYANISNGNNVKVTDIESYCRRSVFLRDGKTFYSSAKDYLDVVIASHKIKQKRIINWSVQIDTLIKQISKIQKYDWSNIKKKNPDKLEKEIRDVIEDYKRNHF